MGTMAEVIREGGGRRLVSQKINASISLGWRGDLARIEHVRSVSSVVVVTIVVSIIVGGLQLLLE